jgi:hypothetical protein
MELWKRLNRPPKENHTPSMLPTSSMKSKEGSSRSAKLTVPDQGQNSSESNTGVQPSPASTDGNLSSNRNDNRKNAQQTMQNGALKDATDRGEARQQGPVAPVRGRREPPWSPSPAANSPASVRRPASVHHPLRNPTECPTPDPSLPSSPASLPNCPPSSPTLPSIPSGPSTMVDLSLFPSSVQHPSLTASQCDLSNFVLSNPTLSLIPSRPLSLVDLSAFPSSVQPPSLAALQRVLSLIYKTMSKVSPGIWAYRLIRWVWKVPWILSTVRQDIRVCV